MDLTYLALQVMYRVRQESGVISDADREHFEDYAERYIAAKGPRRRSSARGSSTCKK